MVEQKEFEIVDAPSRSRIAKATLVALLGAALILVTVVLPAEYGLDPLRTGAVLGLVDLAEADQTDQTPASTAAPVTPPGPAWAHAAHGNGYKQDTIEFKLGPREGMEYKYRIEKGGGLLYSWTATTKVNYEFHAEPDAGPRGYAESFDKQDGKDRAHGAYIAPFPGIHGWYWENTTTREVTVKLTTTGFYSASLEFRRDMEVKTRWLE